jgi:hypothetical protein
MTVSPGLETAHCARCGRFSVWFEERMIYPDQIGLEPRRLAGAVRPLSAGRWLTS